MDQADAKARKSDVRTYLIEGLSEMGMVRKRSIKAEDHEKMLARLVSKLSYMTPSSLAGLRQFVVRLAGGKGGCEWPAEVAILQAAYGIQPPPPRESDYAQSLIRSAMGQRARDEGWMVELFQIAKRMGPPPGKYIIARLRDEAEENNRRRARIKEHAAAGAASLDDRAWLAMYHADLAECTAILDARETGTEA